MAESRPGKPPSDQESVLHGSDLVRRSEDSLSQELSQERVRTLADETWWRGKETANDGSIDAGRWLVSTMAANHPGPCPWRFHV